LFIEIFRISLGSLYYVFSISAQNKNWFFLARQSSFGPQSLVTVCVFLCSTVREGGLRGAREGGPSPLGPAGKQLVPAVGGGGTGGPIREAAVNGCGLLQLGRVQAGCFRAKSASIGQSLGLWGH
jgi:hypothetical protein